MSRIGERIKELMPKFKDKKEESEYWQFLKENNPQLYETAKKLGVVKN